MEEHYPALLSRKKAMQFTGLSRKMLEKFTKENGARFFTTRGGHKRYLKQDLTKKPNEELQ